MIYPVILSPDAKADISAAVRWYERTDPTLAFRFTLEMRVVKSRIARFPYQFPLVNASVRRALLNRFPYLVFFSLKKDRIRILAVLHERRADILRMSQGNGAG